MKALLEKMMKFAGEPSQQVGDQVRGKDKTKSGKEHPFKGRLVGDSVEPNSNMLEELAQEAEEKGLEWELAEAYAKFMEDDLGVEPKRPSRKGSRHARGHEPQPQYKEVKADEEVDEGWESGPEERSYRSRGGDPDDAYDAMRQEKLDAEAERQQALRPQEKYYTLTGRGPNMEPNYAFPGEYDSLDAAVAARKEIMADPKTPNPRMIGINTRTRYLDEAGGVAFVGGSPRKSGYAAGANDRKAGNDYGTTDWSMESDWEDDDEGRNQEDWEEGYDRGYRSLAESRKRVKEGIDAADPVESAVLNAVQELIQQGHTEVAPEVITNMVVAATSQPFLLKDLVDVNNNSAAVQHYVDSINPTKVKFSNEILTVKNEDPMKDKKQAQASVSSMAARAAGRNRLGEASTPLRDREDYDAKSKALQDIQMDPSTNQDPQLTAELARRKAELIQQAKQLGISESRAHKIIANKLKQIELQRQLGSPESDAAYAKHVDSLKKSSAEYVKNNPNTIYKREVDEEVVPTGQQTMADKTGTNDPQQAAKVAQATQALKSATGASAPAPDIAKALDAASKGTAVSAMDMKAIEPMIDVLGQAAQDPKLANQFKTLANQARQAK